MSDMKLQWNVASSYLVAIVAIACDTKINVTHMHKPYLSTLSNQGPAKNATPVKAGSHDVHYHINDLNTEKIPAQQ